MRGLSRVLSAVGKKWTLLDEAPGTLLPSDDVFALVREVACLSGTLESLL